MVGLGGKSQVHQEVLTYTSEIEYPVILQKTIKNCRLWIVEREDSDSINK